MQKVSAKSLVNSLCQEGLERDKLENTSKLIKTLASIESPSLMAAAPAINFKAQIADQAPALAGRYIELRQTGSNGYVCENIVEALLSVLTDKDATKHFLSSTVASVGKDSDLKSSSAMADF
jgi:hypothetical protein